MAVTRLTGISSGMDTDTMIKDLMKAESARLNKVKKNQTSVSWQQEAYREIIGKIRTLQSTFFDTLTPSKNISSSSSFGKFSYSVTSGGVASTAVSVTANADAASKSVVINKITQLATKDTMSGVESDMRGIKTNDFNFEGVKTSLGAAGMKLTVAIGSDSKVIELNETELADVSADALLAGISDKEQLAVALNAKISAAFGADYDDLVSVKNVDPMVPGSGKIEFDSVGSTVRVYSVAGNENTMTELGLTNGQSNMDYNSKTLNQLFGLTDAQIGSITINGKAISLSQEDSYATAMDKINKSGAGVSLKYDSLTDKFALSSTSEGSANNIEITSGSGAEVLFSKMFGVNDFSDVDFNREAGQNAHLQINGIDVVQSSNTFSFDGISYNLKAESAAEINIGITVDKTSIIDNIKNFVTEYNKLIDSISTKYSEKKYYDFEPLTDEEKEALSDDEIKKWEDKAKSGNVRGASELDTFLTKMRNALIEPIEGSNINLAAIGITSSSYTEKGKLTIDETKLSDKLETNFDDIVRLFSQQSDKAYGSNNGAERYRESGIGARLDDIIKDYTRTTRDENGNKGILIMKAGVTNDSSVVNNELTKKMLDYDLRISDLADYLADRETYYYNMFAAMESAMSKLQSQADSLTGMMGSA